MNASSPLRASRRSPAAFVLAAASPLVFAQDASQLVVISAARIEQALPDALPSTRVITRQDIEQAQAADLPSLLRSLTSADVAQTGPLGAQTSVFLRGADSRQTLVLVDGVPINRSDFGLASFQHLPIEQIERIEIVRGNVSSLYGSQAVGGVVQIFTRRASTPEFSVSAGTQHSWSAAAAAGARWGEGAQTTQLSASLSARGTEGFSARTAETGADPDRDGAAQRGANVRLAQGWATGHETTLSLMSDRTRSAYDGYGYPAVGNDVLTTNLDVLGLSSRHAITPAWQLGIDFGSTHERFTDPTSFASSGRNRVNQAGVQLQWRADARQTLQAGVERKSEHFDDVEAGTPTARQRDTDALRVGWVAKSGERIEWQAHLRSDHSDDYGHATTGLFAVGYALTPEWKLSARAGSAFNAPTFIDQQYAAPGTTLKAEHSRDAELALQWSHGTQQARVALFAQRQRDRIDFDPVTFATANIARSRNNGLELMGQLDAGPGRLGVELTLQAPRNAETGEPLKRRARQSLALNYRVTQGRWQWGAALRHTGQRLDTDPVTFANADNPARTTLDLTTQWQINPTWRVAAKLENAGNARTPEILGYTAAPRSLSLQLFARMP
jgi:vitamin B12 transporter